MNPADTYEHAITKNAEAMSWSEGKQLYGQVSRQYIPTVSKALDYDITGAMWFCLFLLEDVNAHDEAAAVKKLFDR